MKYDFNFPIFVHHVKEANDIKETILDMIDKQNSVKQTIDNQISVTDWYCDIGKERKYFKYLRQFIDPLITDILQNTQPFHGEFLSYQYGTVWFQQYYKGDYHIWHNHGSSWASVYFVELSDKNLSTEFYVPFSKEIVKFEVNEGDLLTFPGVLFHRSPVNQTNERKTIVATNITVPANRE